MKIRITVRDRPLAEAVEPLVACTVGATHRATEGRALDYAQIEREVTERTAEIERAAHQRILTGLDVDTPVVVIDGRVHTRSIASRAGTPVEEQSRPAAAACHRTRPRASTPLCGRRRSRGAAAAGS